MPSIRKTLWTFGALTPALGALAMACSSAPSTTDDSTEALRHRKPSLAAHAQIMPLLYEPKWSPETNDPVAELAPSPAFINTQGVAGPGGAKLTYYGGPVLSNVKVWAVYW